MRRIRQNWRWLLLGVVVLIAVVMTGFIFWASTPAGELMETAIQALESDEQVAVSQEPWVVFEPITSEPTAGFVFYPGGRVQAEAYAPIGEALAEAGYLAVIVPMPLNLAILNENGADGVIETYPAIESWAIGGHSLGASMSARYAYNHPDTIAGLVMLAGYPEAWADMSSFENLTVASVYGSFDGLATVEEVEATRSLLPNDAEFVRIEGGNHAQFGWYGPQAGDNPATISREAQQVQTVDAILRVLVQISQPIEDVK